MTTICLPNKKVLSGREYGETFRKENKLNILEDTMDTICILVPETVWSVNASFIIGCFHESIRKLGYRFFEVYNFMAENTIMIQIQYETEHLLKLKG